jgi:hypothetical protein
MARGVPPKIEGSRAFVLSNTTCTKKVRTEATSSLLHACNKNIKNMEVAAHLHTCSRNDEGICVGVRVVLDDCEGVNDTLVDCVDDCELVEY